MKLFLPLIFLFFGYTSNSKKEYTKCDQDRQYICAANTLAMNYRYCMDISEVSGRMYKAFLLDMKKQHGAGSQEYIANMPNWKLWEELYPGKTSSKISKMFFETSTFALAPVVGVTYAQAVKFTEWRTAAFQKELNKMNKRDRANFPKNFEFRLPTPAEWSRMRFMSQEKGMLKEVERIADEYNKEFKIKRNDLLKSNYKVQSVFSEMDEKLGLFNLHDNVAEMTSDKGVAMGGSWKSKSNGDFNKKSEYNGAQAWLGFRCVFEILE